MYYRIARNFRGRKFREFCGFAPNLENLVLENLALEIFLSDAAARRGVVAHTRVRKVVRSWCEKMALLRYFKTTDKLPDPRGPLTKQVPSRSIRGVWTLAPGLSQGRGGPGRPGSPADRRG